MLTYKKPDVQYSSVGLAVARTGTRLAKIGIPLALWFAWGIFFLAIVGIVALVWMVASYVNPLLPWYLRDVVVAVGMVGFVSFVAMVGIWGERKVSGRMQSRLGPMRTGGWHGWAQSLADGLKFVQKEDLIPASADRPLFRLAPYVAMVPAFCAFLAIPFGSGWVFRNADVGLILVLALLSLEVLGVIMAGWASNSKWGLYGAMREACQLVSYEIPMGLSLLTAVLCVGSLSLTVLGDAQAGGWFSWLIFKNPFLFPAFFTYYIASLASCKRAPFDLPEGESELVAGFHTEYSGFRFVMFFFAEYMGMFAVSALAVIIFLGGWNCPFGGPASPLWFVLKASILVWGQMWIRWTLPRIRIDQVMHACVKYFLPMTLVLLVGSSLWQLFDNARHPAFLIVAQIIRYGLGTLGLVLMGLVVARACYGFYHRDRLVGQMARKNLPGA